MSKKQTVTYEMDDAGIKEMLWGCIDHELPEPAHPDQKAASEQVEVVSVCRYHANKTVFEIKVPAEYAMTTDMRGDVQRTAKED